MRKLAAIAVLMSLATAFATDGATASPQKPTNPPEPQMPQTAPDGTREMTLPFRIVWDKDAKTTTLSDDNETTVVPGFIHASRDEEIATPNADRKSATISSSFRFTPTGSELVTRSSDGANRRFRFSWWLLQETK